MRVLKVAYPDRPLSARRGPRRATAKLGRTAAWPASAWRTAARRFAADQSGATAMEFTFVMLPMIVLVFAIIQFGGILFLKNDMQNAARDASRRMAASYLCFQGGPVQCGAQTPNYVEDFACGYLGDWTPAFAVDVSETDSPDGTDMAVTITTDMGAAAFVDLFGLFEGRTMSATAVLRREYEPETPLPPCP